MFSSRLFVFFALAALTAAYPANDDGFFPRPITTITDTDFDDPSPWFRFPAFGNIFAPLTKLFSAFADIGPRIESDDDKFRVVVNVKDYGLSDLKVKVKGDFILVQGAHEAKQDDHDLFASQFIHTYSLPINASAADVTAKVTADKYLIITAPINGADAEKEKVVEREVPIVESTESWNNEEKVDKDKKPEDVPVKASDAAPVTESDAIPAKESDAVPVKESEAVPVKDSDVAPIEIDEAKSPVTTGLPAALADEDNKEATTPSNREEVTIRDIPDEVNEVNSLNEIQP